LKIETGRYQGTLLQDRKCERCSSGSGRWISFSVSL
jgi:hypothetical protein